MRVFKRPALFFYPLFAFGVLAFLGAGTLVESLMAS